MERQALMDRFSEVAALPPLLVAEISADYREAKLLQRVRFNMQCGEIGTDQEERKRQGISLWRYRGCSNYAAARSAAEFNSADATC